VEACRLSHKPQYPDLLRRIWRRIYWLPHDVSLARTYRGVRRLVYFGGDGVGDELLLTTVLHELRARGGRDLGVMTSRPELFAHSPDVDHLRPVRHDHVAALRRLGRRVDQLVYIERRLPPDIDVPPPRHLLAEMCRLAGVTGAVSLRPYLYLTEAERRAVRRPAPYLVMQSSRRSASLVIANKEWFPERFQVVADVMRQECQVVQIGLASDPLLQGAEDLRGRTSLRESAALLAGAAAFVGLVGLLMHLARAVDCPAVIVYGGRERPDQSGYSANRNLFSPVPCAPCWRWNSCDFNRRCMDEITAEQVAAATCALLASPPARPLPVETAIIGAAASVGVTT